MKQVLEHSIKGTFSLTKTYIKDNCEMGLVEVQHSISTFYNYEKALEAYKKAEQNGAFIEVTLTYES